MTKDQVIKCNAIIHSASVAAAAVGAGLAQLPCSDNAILVPIQVSMVLSLGAVFNINLTKSAAKSSVATASATLVGRGISQALVGWIPGIENIINASTASTVTEGIGWIVAKNFEKEACC